MRIEVKMERHISYTVKLTRAANALANKLENGEKPVLRDYDLFFLLKEIYKNPEGLYLRNKKLNIDTYRRTRRLLVKAKIISRDKDYPNTYTVLSHLDLPADDIICMVDPFAYISHLSAMQRYGLTDRRPEALHITTPEKSLAKNLIQRKMEHDYEISIAEINPDEFLRLTITHHPLKVRKRKIENYSTKSWGDHVQLRGSHARISSIGQTFLDMLDKPELCGGMSHIIDVWKEYAQNYIQDIIVSINNSGKPIYKVRAGYIFDEVMGIQKPEITEWEKYAQRGGSRILDSTKPFINNYSEKWMISINV